MRLVTNDDQILRIESWRECPRLNWKSNLESDWRSNTSRRHGRTEARQQLTIERWSEAIINTWWKFSLIPNLHLDRLMGWNLRSNSRCKLGVNFSKIEFGILEINKNFASELATDFNSPCIKIGLNMGTCQILTISYTRPWHTAQLTK